MSGRIDQLPAGLLRSAALKDLEKSELDRLVLEDNESVDQIAGAASCTGELEPTALPGSG